MTTYRHEYPPRRLEFDRRNGLLICRCDEPIPVPLTMWGSVECEQCGRKVAS